MGRKQHRQQHVQRDRKPTPVEPVAEPVQEPTPEDVRDAGFLGDLDPTPSVESDVLEAICVASPSREEVLAAGYSDSEADGVLDAFAAAASAVDIQTSHRDLRLGRATRTHYLVKSPSKRGYWAAGRHFGQSEQVVFVDELSKAQIREMEQANPLHLSVERVGALPGNT